MSFHRYSMLSFFLITLLSCSSTDKPIFNEREFISLAGIWKTNLGEIKLPGTVDESKLAPRTTDTLSTGQLTRLHPYEGKMRYTKEVTISSVSANKEWRLIMERSKPSSLWIDSDSIGSCTTILSPQIYNIGRLSEGKHTISIDIDNGELSVPEGIKGSHAWTDATQTNWNGIIGKFGLEANDGVLMESVQVYPAVNSKVIPVIAQISSSQNVKAKILVKGYVWNTDQEIALPEQEIELILKKGSATYNFNMEIGEKQVLWSEFDPALYKVNFELIADNMLDHITLNFGIRDFSSNGTQFTINSLKTFLRGKHDACVFPLTGYPPMDKEEWVRQFRISKEYGINHYRFHSWTPPQAAFDAANEEGIYLQPELPYWGMMDKKNDDLNHFLINEGQNILNAYGNNPSFVMMALGNELGGDVDYMCEIVSKFKSQDNRHLYALGANNFLGTAGQQSGEDFLVTCRVGGQVGSSDFSNHTRSTFSFADAKEGGYMNGTYPSTDKIFSKAVLDCTVPIISHENGQFQSYPDYKEIDKYTGVLYPSNLNVFKNRLISQELFDQAEKFQKATARFSAICYKEDIEMCLRTPGFGGFQILDLQDYPGQGSAYVGILDAFMDSKGGISARNFRGFCSQVVPLALFSKYTWNNNESFIADIKLFNYSAEAISDKPLKWTFRKKMDGAIIQEGVLLANAQQGTLSDIGKLVIPLKDLEIAEQLKLSLQIGEQINNYDLWVYPTKVEPINDLVSETSSLSEVLTILKAGQKVLFMPSHQDVKSLSVGGMFTPDYWNYAMFKNISESLDRDVSPGTLSLLTNPNHPLFKNFPTDFCSNWQWWAIMKNSRPFILDHTPKGFTPLIQVIDNIERNHKLGLLFEAKVGKGKLLVSMCNLEDVIDKAEGRQFHHAILSYMSSPNFNPQVELSENELQVLFSSKIVRKEIIGVKNITNYQ